jgi:hypothetical protein
MAHKYGIIVYQEIQDIINSFSKFSLKYISPNFKRIKNNYKNITDS